MPHRTWNIFEQLYDKSAELLGLCLLYISGELLSPGLRGPVQS